MVAGGSPEPEARKRLAGGKTTGTGCPTISDSGCAPAGARDAFECPPAMFCARPRVPLWGAVVVRGVLPFYQIAINS